MDIEYNADGEFLPIERDVIPSKIYNVEKQADAPLQVVDFSQATAYYNSQHSISSNFHTGDKFQGGFGITQLLTADYYTLRARSNQLFKDNIYARGLLRRLITNEINSGLTLECLPEEVILGLKQGTLDDWAEEIEITFDLWAKDKRLCHYQRTNTFYELQQIARLESLIEGDILVVNRVNRQTGLPNIQLIPGSKIVSPGFDKYIDNGNQVKHGVEIDKQGRHVAFWIKQSNNRPPVRMAAFGVRSGRPQAWLMYGTELRLDEVRGEPLLSIILQSLKEIDRYRDAAQRKAVINSILAMFIKKGEDKPSSRPMTGSAIKRSSQAVSDEVNPARISRDIANHTPGLIIEELQEGEEPVGFGSQGTDINFPIFEDAMIASVAWCMEVPPDIMRLAFTRNYAGNQGIINEFKQYLDKVQPWIANGICAPVYKEFFVNRVLRNDIDADGYIESTENPRLQLQAAAWTNHHWLGKVKPSTDPNKTLAFYTGQIDRGLVTHAKAARELNGTKWSRNIKTLMKEREVFNNLPDAPILERTQQAQDSDSSQADSNEELHAEIDELREQIQTMGDRLGQVSSQLYNGT